MPTFEQVLKAIAPKANPQFVAASVACDAVGIMVSYGFVDVNSQAQLLGHSAVESMYFTRFDENLNYKAETLMRTWPKRFPNMAVAEQYAHNPQKLANFVYNGRMGNRPGTNDGYDNRGSGELQHTGADERDRVSHRTGVPADQVMERLRSKADAELKWKAACSFFKDRKAMEKARAGDTQGTCLIINGGVNGLSDRVIMVNRALKALNGQPLVGAGKVLSPVIVPPSTPTTPTVQTQTAPPAPQERTTVEVQDDEKKKRDRAIVGTAAGAPTGGGLSSTVDYVLAAGVVILVVVVGVVLIRKFWRSHAAATQVVEGQQLMQIAQRIDLKTV